MAASTPATSPDLAAPATPARTFWQRRVRDPIVAQLTQGITPEKIALTVAIGSCIALFPILGTTTLLCFLVALLLRLNQPIIQLINQALWPIHVPAIFGCVKLGELILGATHVHFSLRHMHEMFWKSPAAFFQEFGATALHAIVGWAIVAPFYMTAVYFITLPIMRTVTRLKAEAAAKDAALHPEHPIP
ncbi:MAG: DUF2062 domain-containing protein [Verrucomicrobiota bacterium]